MNEVPVVSAIIPCLDEETAIGKVVTTVLALANVSKVYPGPAPVTAVDRSILSKA